MDVKSSNEASQISPKTSTSGCSECLWSTYIIRVEGTKRNRCIWSRDLFSNDIVSVNFIDAEEMSAYGHNPECAPPEGWGREEESERPVQEVGKYAEESRNDKEEVDPGLDNK